MGYIPDADAALFGNSTNLGIFIKIDLDVADGGPLRLWLGINDVPAHFDNIEVADATYHGAGKLVTAPDFDVIINGTAERIEITMEGVSAEAQALIDMANPQVVGRRVFIGMGGFDEKWQRTTEIIALSQWTADYWASAASVAVGDEPQTRALSLSCASGDIARSRPRRATYTQAQQKLRFPTDDFCINVLRYDRGFTLSWPRF